MGLVRVVYDSRWLFVVAGLLGYVAYKVHVYNRLKAFKGPFSSGWFEFWHSYAIIGDNQHLKYKEVCEKYGPSSFPVPISPRPSYHMAPEP
jgi:hypothetical protein